MGIELRGINPDVLSETDRTEIDTNIEALIAAHKNNRQEINRLVFESVEAMTTGEDYERQLANKKGLWRFLGTITGSNKKLQDKINSNRALAQYASQQILQRLAEQNLMSFDLIAAVNNKLNASVIGIESEINEIYGALKIFFKQSKSDIVKLESRVDQLEKNVNLLNWQNAIEYQMFAGMEYPELDNVSKIVCLTRDFYDITKGEWTTSDLLLLKSAMSAIDISPRDSINFYDFIQHITYNRVLSDYLLEGKRIQSLPESYLVPLLGMKKLELLKGEERYLVDTIVEQMEENGIPAERRSIESRLARKYLRQEAQVNVDIQVNHYDLIIEMLFNLQAAEKGDMLKGTKESNVNNAVEEPLEDTFERAAELFKKCELKEAYPLLVRLSDNGYARANALLYWLLCDGFEEHPSDEAEAVQYAEKGYWAGDPICALQYALFGDVTREERISLCKRHKPTVKDLADALDVFAAYMMGICYKNETDEKPDQIQTSSYFFRAWAEEFYRGCYSYLLYEYEGGRLHLLDNWANELVSEYPKYLQGIGLAADVYCALGKNEEALKAYQKLSGRLIRPKTPYNI